MMIPVDEQIKIIAKGADEIINVEDLKAKLEKSQKTSKPLTVKLGLDPSAPDIHLGLFPRSLPFDSTQQISVLSSYHEYSH
jgi:tyrosyl-tRNA synthetase